MPVAVPPALCPPDLPRRFLTSHDIGECGLIQSCDPPYVATVWPAKLQIPNRWVELGGAVINQLPPPAEIIRIPVQTATGLEVTVQGPLLCRALAAPIVQAVALGVTAQQQARAGLLEPRTPLQPRLARRSRPARVPRLPRRPRAARRPRRRRAPRLRRTKAARRPRVPRPPPKKWYCTFYKTDPKRFGDSWHGGKDELDAAEAARYRSLPFFWYQFVWNKEQSCPTPGDPRCQQQAEAFVKPLQKLLGWTRPERPPAPELTEAQLRERVRGSVERARRRPPRREAAPEPPPPGPGPAIPNCTYVKDISNRVDGYLVDPITGIGGTKCWSNYEHGPWAGTIPAGLPYGAGIGA